MTTNDLNLRALCEKGDVEGVRRTLEEGGDVNATTKHGMSALHFASIQGHSEIAAALLEAQAKPNQQNANGQTPLELAAVKGHAEVVKLLLDAGCEINRQTKFSGMTALHLAAKNGHNEVVKLLQSYNADEEILDEIRKPPVYYSANEETARLFLHPHEARILQAKYQNGDTKQDRAGHLDRTTENRQKIPQDSMEEDRRSTRLEHDEESNKKAKRNKGKIHSNDHEGRPRKEVSETKRLPESPDGMESPSAGRRGIGVGNIQHENKNFVANHRVEFSEEHKKRMKMNVFDRLLGGKK